MIVEECIGSMEKCSGVLEDVRGRVVFCLVGMLCLIVVGDVVFGSVQLWIEMLDVMLAHCAGRSAACIRSLVWTLQEVGTYIRRIREACS